MFRIYSGAVQEKFRRFIGDTQKIIHAVFRKCSRYILEIF
jgi:hypothetical protein